MGSASLDVAWAPVRWLAIEGNVPFRSAGILASFLDEHREPLPGFESIHHRTEVLVGPADPRIGARWQPLAPDEHWGIALLVWGGLQVPVGRIEPDPFELGRRGKRHQHIFFGTGVFTPVLGGRASWGVDWIRVGGDVQASVAPYANRHGYLPPSRGQISAYVESGFGLEDWTFRLQPTLSGETPATWSGRPARNSGRIDPSVAGAIFWRARTNMELWTQVRVTPYTFAIGGQLIAPVLALAGVSWDIALPELGS